MSSNHDANMFTIACGDVFSDRSVRITCEVAVLHTLAQPVASPEQDQASDVAAMPRDFCSKIEVVVIQIHTPMNDQPSAINLAVMSILILPCHV